MEATNKSSKNFQLNHQQLPQMTLYSTHSTSKLYPAFTMMNQQQIYASLTQLITQWKLNPQTSLHQNSNKISLPSFDSLSCQWEITTLTPTQISPLSYLMYISGLKVFQRDLPRTMQMFVILDHGWKMMHTRVWTSKILGNLMKMFVVSTQNWVMHLRVHARKILQLLAKMSLVLSLKFIMSLRVQVLMNFQTCTKRYQRN